MRIGINFVPQHETPEQWADILVEKGYRASVFPGDYRQPVSTIDAYVQAARARDIRIAEVGVWNSPHHPDPARAEQAREVCLEKFRLAEYVGADCCVNVSGAAGPVWFACYPENYSPALYEQNVAFVQYLCDTVKPRRTSFALEPMQWMLPHSVEQYRRFLRDVNRAACKVHMDILNFISDPWLYTHQAELMDNAFRTLGSDIVSCHIKDIRMRRGTSVVIEETEIGTGEAELGTYLAHIRTLAPDMPVLIEHLDTMEQYDNARAYLLQTYGV